MIRKDMRFDVRALPHRLRRKELTAEQIEEHLESLEDDAAECEETDVVFARRFEERHKAAAANKKA